MLNDIPIPVKPFLQNHHFKMSTVLFSNQIIMATSLRALWQRNLPHVNIVWNQCTCCNLKQYCPKVHVLKGTNAAAINVIYAQGITWFTDANRTAAECMELQVYDELLDWAPHHSKFLTRHLFIGLDPMCWFKRLQPYVDLPINIVGFTFKYTYMYTIVL